MPPNVPATSRDRNAKCCLQPIRTTVGLRFGNTTPLLKHSKPLVYKIVHGGFLCVTDMAKITLNYGNNTKNVHTTGKTS
jgi:hypothetical protein